MAVDTIQKAAEEWRKRLREPDYSDPLAGAQERLLAKSYVEAWDVLKKKWDGLAAQVNSDQTRRTAGALYRMERYKDLMRAVEQHLDELSSEAVTAAQDGGFRSIDAAINQMVRENRPAGYGPTTGDWEVRGDRVRAEAITAFNSEFSPLTSLLQRYGNEAATAARSAIVSGVIAGVSTDTIGRQLRTALGTSLWHATLIARTEAHRAYRESQRIFVEQNRDVFRGYVWRAACDAKTCAICWERHGTFYPVWTDKAGVPHAPPMETHPGCRCALVPRSRSLTDIVGDKSIDDVRPKDTGREKFAKLTEAQQRRVLGPKRLELYKNGTRLSDMIELRPSGRWGRTPRLKSLKELNAPVKPKPVKPPKPTPGGPTPGGPGPSLDEIRAKTAEYRAAQKEYEDQRGRYLTADNEAGTSRRAFEAVEADHYNPGYAYNIRSPAALQAMGITDTRTSSWLFLDHQSFGDPGRWTSVPKARFLELLGIEESHWLSARSTAAMARIHAGEVVDAMKPLISTFPTRHRVDPARREGLAPTRRVSYDDFMAAVTAYEEVILTRYGYAGRSRWQGRLNTAESSTFGGMYGWGDDATVTIEQKVFMGRLYNQKGAVPGKGKSTSYDRGDYLKVILHEAGHSMNPLLPGEFVGRYGWEEGVVEGAAQAFEQEFWEVAGMRGVGYSKKLPAGSGLTPGYKSYSSYTREWRRVLGLYNDRVGFSPTGRGMTEQQWFGELLAIPSPKRPAWVVRKLEQAGYSDMKVKEILDAMDAVFAVRVS